MSLLSSRRFRAALAAALLFGVSLVQAQLATDAHPRCSADGKGCDAHLAVAGFAASAPLSAYATKLASIGTAAPPQVAPALDVAIGALGHRRQPVFLNDVSADGAPVSHDNGPIAIDPFLLRIGACLMALGVLASFFLLGEPLRASRQPARSAEPVADSAVIALPAPAPMASSNGTVATTVALEATQEAAAPGSFADLVIACNGDAARAGTVLNGVVAAQPRLQPHSHEALDLALRLVKG